MSELTDFAPMTECVIRPHVEQGEITDGDVVQLDPNTVLPRRYGGCFMVVETTTNWGACGYVFVPGQSHMVEIVQLRVSYEHMVKIGRAEWKRQP